MPFDVINPSKVGFLGLEAQEGIDKRERGQFLSTGVRVLPEKTNNLNDNKADFMVEPGNALFWKHSDKGQIAPRGAWGSWSFAIPARHMGNDEYLPLALVGKTDIDFQQEKVQAAAGWGGTPPVGTDAIILATTEHGDHEKVAFSIGGGGGSGSPIIAHWLGNSPPKYSTHVSDISGDSPDPQRHAGLDTIFRVRKWVPPCSSQSSSSDVNQYAIMLTGNASPEGQGYLPVTFGDTDALFSYMMSGPFVPSFFAKHGLSKTGDATISAGAISTNAYFRGSSMPYTAPLRFEEDLYPKVQNGTIAYEVHRKYDPDMVHPFACADKKGMWREYVKIPIGETPPCKPTKYAPMDINENPARTFNDGRVIIPKNAQTLGIFFQPRANLMNGRS